MKKSSAHNESRRNFLKSSALAGGTLMLGMTLPFAGGRLALASVAHRPNAWIRISDDNTITLLSNHSEMGQGVYTALPMLLAEELSVDLKQVKIEIAPPGKAYINPILGGQLTGGSASVRGMHIILRTAGAQVREMLVSAAAAKWGVDASRLTAANGVVSGPGGKRATYGQLAEAASRLPVPENVRLKDAKDFRIVGKSIKRLDTPSKVNGSAVFGIDVKLPGMVYAAIQMCPVVGGSVKSFDGTAAKTQPGVIDVVPTGDGVAVVADSWWRARKARDLLKIEWDEGPSAKVSTASLRNTFLKALDTGTPIPAGKPVGDVDAALQKAAKVFRADYWSHSLAHATLEPQNFTAYYKDGKLRLIGPTQNQGAAQAVLAMVLQMKPEDITVETTFLGGGFGRRLELDFIIQAALISKALSRPVKLIWTREDDTTHDFYRPIAINRFEIGLDEKGMPTAWKFKLSSQSVTMRFFQWKDPNQYDPFMAEYAITAYNLPNAKYDIYNTDAGMRVGFWRAVSHPINTFANEGVIDELAALAGKDPVAYRLSLLEGKARHTHVLEVAARKSGWDTPVPAGRTRGVALMEGYEGVHALVSEISLLGGVVKVHKVTVVSDIGMLVNPDIAKAQIQSSVAFGLGAALMQEITFENGRAQQRNFDSYPLLRMNEHPPLIDITLVESAASPAGIGEPIAAVVQAATANAVSTALGKRIRKLPMTPEAISKA